MKELFNRIIEWGSDKGIHDIQFEPLVQIGFLLEELHEVNKEFIAGSTDKAVGEICDLIVYSVNALMLIKQVNQLLNLNFKSEKYTELVVNIDVIKQLNMSIHSIMCNIKCRVSLPITYTHLISNCCRSINALGYSPEIALEETIKKIESRRGAMNPVTGKWEKFIGQRDIYKPDYSKARLNND